MLENREQTDEPVKELESNLVDSLPSGQLAAKLAEAERQQRPLRVKLGIDPTAPDIHLGHTVVLNKLRQFQDLGHTVVLIIGDYTARVGDPSGRSSTRPVLSGEEIDANAQTFKQQAFKVLDRERIEVRYNSEWLDMSMEQLFAIARGATVGQLLARDDFAKRYGSGTPISVLELLYPLMQAYDSVAVKADVELGGTDQKFNLLLGRDLQKQYGQSQQVALTLPILPGIDGERRMSKSLGNYIGVTDPPEEIYGKTLRLPDSALDTYYRLLLDLPLDTQMPPRDAKRQLARALVERFYDVEQALGAEQAFDRLHRDRAIPEDVPEVTVVAEGTVHLPQLVADQFGLSRSEARRLLGQGGVKINGQAVIADVFDLSVDELHGAVVQVGKRRFVRVFFRNL